MNLKIKKRKKSKTKGISLNKVWITFAFESSYIFLIELFFKILLGTLNFDWTLLRIFLSSCITSGLLTIITSNIKPIIRKTILIVFNLFVVFYAWIQLGFIDFLGAFMSMGNAEQGTKITDYIFDFLLAFNWKSHLLYIPFVLTIIYFIFEKKLLNTGYEKKINFKNKYLVLGIIMSFLVTICLFYSTVKFKFMQNKFQSVSNKDLLQYPSNPSITIKNFGTTIYFFLDLKGTLFGGEVAIHTSDNNETLEINTSREIDDTLWKKVIDNETDSVLNTLNNYYINRKISDKNEYTGLFKDKNLIFIMLESIGYAVFDESYKEYFPTLYMLQSEGISAINNYSPRNNCATGESEMTSQLGLYSIETTCTVNTYRNNIYPEAIQNMLRNNGYYTTAYHDYTDQYYYRSIYEYNFGSSLYYGVTNLGMSYNPIYKEWPSDLVFMEKAIPMFINSDKFSSYMVTVTAHTPYIYNTEFGNMYLSLFDNLDVDKPTKRYLSKVKVVDLALEYLLSSLEEAGKLDDTVIVLFGDHYPYALNNREYASIAKYDISYNQEIDKTPFIIYNSKTDPITITKYISPPDYTPTLLNLFGIDYDPRLYLGNDIFSDYEDFVLFPDNSWQNSKGFYSASKGEFISKDNKEMSDEEIIKLNVLANDLRNMSGLSIKKNYFKYLYNSFDKEGNSSTNNQIIETED